MDCEQQMNNFIVCINNIMYRIVLRLVFNVLRADNTNTKSIGSFSLSVSGSVNGPFHFLVLLLCLVAFRLFVMSVPLTFLMCFYEKGSTKIAVHGIPKQTASTIKQESPVWNCKRRTTCGVACPEGGGWGGGSSILFGGTPHYRTDWGTPRTG